MAANLGSGFAGFVTGLSLAAGVAAVAAPGDVLIERDIHVVSPTVAAHADAIEAELFAAGARTICLYRMDAGWNMDATGRDIVSSLDGEEESVRVVGKVDKDGKPATFSELKAAKGGK